MKRREFNKLAAAAALFPLPMLAAKRNVISLVVDKWVFELYWTNFSLGNGEYESTRACHHKIYLRSEFSPDVSGKHHLVENSIARRISVPIEGRYLEYEGVNSVGKNAVLTSFEMGRMADGKQHIKMIEVTEYPSEFEHYFPSGSFHELFV